VYIEECSILNQAATTLTKVSLENARILVVDDQPINIQVINQMLGDCYHLRFAKSGQAALDICLSDPPDLILMDVVMPELDGLTTCKIIKNTPEISDIPVVFITSLQKSEEENACWQAGGIDYMVKPVNPLPLRNRVNAHLTLKFQADLLKKLAYLDGLTSVYNRRYLNDYLTQQTAQAKRSNQPLSLLMVDIDYFKQFNDEYGHLFADDQLKQTALSIKRTLQRPTDIVARFGGEEFVCVLPNTGKLGARHVAESIMQNIAALKITHKLSPHQSLTVSIGTATIEAKQDYGTDLIAIADKHLYKAKQTGRNKAI
tara:strand:+ start:142620 stop:143564 length:945 start_codon:yes stop_codon:yes gene_type:complete